VKEVLCAYSVTWRFQIAVRFGFRRVVKLGIFRFGGPTGGPQIGVLAVCGGGRGGAGFTNTDLRGKSTKKNEKYVRYELVIIKFRFVLFYFFFYSGNILYKYQAML
jgi:hypothetical protein